MQDRGPPINVILIEQLARGSYCGNDLFHSRVSVNSLYICICNALRKWCQPTLRFPLGCVGPPNRWVTVQIIDLDEHVCVFRYKNFMDFATIDIVNGGRKWKDDITSCATG